MMENGDSSQLQNAVNAHPHTAVETVYHAVYIPQDNGNTVTESNAKENIHVYQDKSEALKIIRTFKTGRLKTFKSCAEATEFAKTGFERNITNNISTPLAVPIVEEKSNNFKGPRPQDLVCFRKLIESGDVYAVKSTIWGNPRYLVSSGDTPAILHEGCRYNALHVAVKADKSEMCELILNTVGNEKFMKLLYGEEECKSYLNRAQIMLDLYLNTPDKGLNETPLHFAVKFGLKDVVKVLVSYPHCIKTLPNKYKQTPIDLICSRKGQDNEELKKQIRMLVEDQYYVPVLRSEDNTIQPVIGEPFSPTSPMSFKSDPISPRVEVRAFAGPMTKSRALEFRKKWKTPPRLRGASAKKNSDNDLTDSSASIDSVVLRLQDAEKGLERIGRNLAEEYEVSWKEYWPFLNDFADFRCKEGLIKLEKYLEHNFKDRLLYYCNQDRVNNAARSEKALKAADEMDYLCNKLQSCTLINNDEGEKFYTPPSSPRLLSESSDDEMQLAEEGSRIFLEGPVPTKLDYAVYNAVSSSIDPSVYPNVYLWRHDMQLAMQSDTFRSKNKPTIRRKLVDFLHV